MGGEAVNVDCGLRGHPIMGKEGCLPEIAISCQQGQEVGFEERWSGTGVYCEIGDSVVSMHQEFEGVLG